MAQLKSTVVQGSLRVTDTTYTTDLNLSSATASQFVKTDANKNLITSTLSKSDVGLNNVTNDKQLPIAGGTMTGRLTAAKGFNNLLTGTGTAGVNNSGTYTPVKWTFDAGVTVTDGDRFTVKIPNITNADWGVFMSVNNGTNYYPVGLLPNGRLTTHYAAGCYIDVVFEASGRVDSVFPLAGGTARTNITSGGVWRVINYYDSNSDWGYYQRMIYPNLKAGTGSVHPHSIIMQLANGRWASITSTAPNNPGASNVSPKATGKVANTNEFRLSPIYVMYANATYADGANIGTYNVYAYHSNLIDARYSFNLENDATNGFTAYSPVYIVGTISNGLFKLDTTKWWSCTLPSNDDGKVYIHIGDAYDWYRLTLQEHKPIYWYKDGALRPYSSVTKTMIGLGNVTNDAQIAKSIGTAKGDMLYFTANATPTRLAIGTAGSILNATSDGPAWTNAIKVEGTGTTRKITLNDRLFGVDNYNIGTALPQTGENNQIFFQISDPFYELPLEGQAGMVLAKVTEDARSTAWTNILTYNYDIKNLNDTDNGSISRVRVIDPDSATASTSVSLQWDSDNKRGVLDNAINKWLLYIDPGDNYAHCGTRLYGAVWNDYAEYRISSDSTPGRVVQECGDDTLKLSTARLSPGCNIISDTYGFAIGQTSRANTPIAISGRVLAYPYESIDEFKTNIGKPVCSGPNGTVSIMSDEEYQKYGYCCLGTISAIPNYETWGEDNIAVRGRVWIQVR